MYLRMIVTEAIIVPFHVISSLEVEDGAIEHLWCQILIGEFSF